MTGNRCAVHSRQLAVIAIVMSAVIAGCATSGNDTVRAPGIVAGTSALAPVKAPRTGIDSPAGKPVLNARRSQAVPKAACKIKGDSVAWILRAGSCRNGYAHGEGRADSVDGVRHYTGGFANGAFQGDGTYDWGNGVRYTGRFVRGSKTGRGTVVYPDNRKYVGGFKDGLYSGFGVYTDSDGSVYEGEFRAGRFEGRGTYVWANGDKYTGQFHDNLMEGDGLYVRANGEKYNGQFSQNERNGTGTYRWPNGDQYTGQFEEGEIDGEGVYLHADGTKYVGHFLAGKKDGWGRLTTANGEFRQRWRKGQKLAEEKVLPRGGGRAAAPAENASATGGRQRPDPVRASDDSSLAAPAAVRPGPHGVSNE